MSGKGKKPILPPGVSSRSRVYDIATKAKIIWWKRTGWVDFPSVCRWACEEWMWLGQRERQGIIMKKVTSNWLLHQPNRDTTIGAQLGLLKSCVPLLPRCLAELVVEYAWTEPHTADCRKPHKLYPPHHGYTWREVQQYNRMKLVIPPVSLALCSFFPSSLPAFFCVWTHTHISTYTESEGKIQTEREGDI